MALAIFGQKRQGELDEVIKGYDLFRDDVKKSVFLCECRNFIISHGKRKGVVVRCSLPRCQNHPLYIDFSCRWTVFCKDHLETDM